MPQAKDTVRIRFSMRAAGGPFWQTNATIASVHDKTVVLDGFDREVTTTTGELRRSGPNQWVLDWEIRTRP